MKRLKIKDSYSNVFSFYAEKDSDHFRIEWKQKCCWAFFNKTDAVELTNFIIKSFELTEKELTI